MDETSLYLSIFSLMFSVGSIVQYILYIVYIFLYATFNKGHDLIRSSSPCSGHCF